MIKRHQKAEARRQTKQKRRKKLVYSSSCLPSITFFLSSTTPSSSHTFRTSARRELFENEKSRKILIHHRGVNLFLYAVVARREKLFSLFCRPDSSRLATLSEENRQSYLNNADAITSLWKTSDRKLSKKNIFLYIFLLLPLHSLGSAESGRHGHHHQRTDSLELSNLFFIL
jgi:hypothetical protein